jgi:ubiquitin-protein ligase
MCIKTMVRLQKDIKELKACGLNGISLQQSDDSGSIIVQFTEMIPFAPALFRISVPRYYPHNHPIVFCITEGFPCPFISPTGEITHPRLREDWSAVGTLLTVIETLQSIRLMRHNTFCVDHSSSGHSILEEIHDAPKEAYAINMAEGILPGEES